MKTLVVVGHPHLGRSVVNKAWREALRSVESEDIIVHVLSDVADENGEFDIEAEHDLLKSVDRVVLQFPLYWYMPPSIMVHWMTTVWCDGWAYGEGGVCMEHLLLEVACSCGAPEVAFGQISLETYLSFLRGSAGFLRCRAGRIFAFYGAEAPDAMSRLPLNVEEYVRFVADVEDIDCR